MLNNIAKLVLGLPRYAKQWLVASVDTFLCILSVWVSFYLRLGEFPAFRYATSTPVLITSTASVALAVPIFVVSGLYRAIFRYSGMPAMMTITLAMLIYGI